MNTKFLKPALGPDGTPLSVVILDGNKARTVKPEGEQLQLTRGVRRRIADGDLVEASEPGKSSAPAGKASKGSNSNPASE